MQKLIQNVENEGLVSFMGKRIFIMGLSFFYEGILTGINKEYILIEDAAVVVDSGDFTKDKIDYCERVKSGKIYLMKKNIESFFESHLKC